MDALESLEVWRRACRLCVDWLQLSPSCGDAGYRWHVNRTALSIPSDIAEGYERDAPGDLIRFLRMAKGSCGEFRTQLYVGVEVGLVDRSDGLRMVREAVEMSRMLQGLIRHYVETG